MQQRAVQVSLNPNPPLRGETLVDPHGRHFPMSNDPFIAVELHDYPLGNYTITMTKPLRLEHHAHVDSSFRTVYFLDDRLADPAIRNVSLRILGPGVDESVVEDIRVHMIRGTIRDLTGRPRQAYAWQALNRPIERSTVVRSDKQGRYMIYLPEGKRTRLFINDVSYGSSSLETWVMARGLRRDATIDPRIGGGFEFYEFNAWQFDGIWNLFFLPAVVDAKIPPVMRREDVTVSIDGHPAAVTQFTRHRVLYKGKAKKAWYPAYVLSVVPRKTTENVLHQAVIRIRTDSRRLGKGEAWFVHDRTTD